MFQVPAPAENPGKFQRITQIPHDSPTQPANHANSAHFTLKLTRMLLTFRSLTIATERREIGANQQDSAQFVHLLREFRAFHSKLIHV